MVAFGGKKSLTLFIIAAFLVACVAPASAKRVVKGTSKPTKAVGRSSPSQVVSDLYKAHRNHQGPFLQTKSRSRVDRYFDRRLANLIWKDAVQSKGEVGALDFDPLYDTQEDFPVTNFRVHPPAYHGGKAAVNVTFKRLGGTVAILYRLIREGGRWKIDDIVYRDGTSLAGLLKRG